MLSKCYYSLQCFEFTLYTLYVLPANLINLRSTIYHQSSEPIYAPVSTFYQPLCSIYTLRSTIYHQCSKLCTLYILPAALFNLRSTLHFQPSKPMYALLSMFYQLLSSIYALWSTLNPLSTSTLYTLPATLFNLRSMIYHQPSKPIYTLPSPFYHSLSFTLFALPSEPICLEAGYWNFFIFLTKTSEQHKERLLVVVSFFVYFWRASSLSETSSRNDLSVPKFRQRGQAVRAPDLKSVGRGFKSRSNG